MFDARTARPLASSGDGRPVLVVGAGAAARCAVEALRAEGYAGPIALAAAAEEQASATPALPGTTPLGSAVVALDVAACTARCADGLTLAWSRAVLALDARLQPPTPFSGALPIVRSVAEARALMAGSARLRQAVVVGATLVALELAASLVERGLAVTVVHDDGPMLSGLLGDALAAALRSLVTGRGVTLVAGRVRHVEGARVTLDDGQVLEADLVLGAFAAVPSTALARAAGLAVEGGVLVDLQLATSAPGVFAIGECVRWPDRQTGARATTAHWAGAQRQAEVMARTLLGKRDRFDAAPFFRARLFDVTLTFLGNVEAWDTVEVQGALTGDEATVTWREGERLVAVVTLTREGGVRRGGSRSGRGSSDDAAQGASGSR